MASLCFLTCPHEALLAQTWARRCCRSAGCRSAIRSSIRGASVWGRSAPQRRVCLPLPTHQLREWTDFLAWPPPPKPLTNLPHPSAEEGINTEFKSSWGERCSFSVSRDFSFLFYIPPPTPPPLLTRLICCRWDQTGLNLKRTRRHFVISEISSSLFHQRGGSRLRGASWKLRGASSSSSTRRKTDSAVLRSAPGLHPNVTACTASLIYLRWARDAAARVLRRKAHSSDESFWLTAFEELASFSQWETSADAAFLLTFAVNTESGQRG